MLPRVIQPQPREIGLGRCGDWLNGGKLEGAWLSGRALAEQALLSFAPCRWPDVVRRGLGRWRCSW